MSSALGVGSDIVGSGLARQRYGHASEMVFHQGLDGIGSGPAEAERCESDLRGTCAHQGLDVVGFCRWFLSLDSG